MTKEKKSIYNRIATKFFEKYKLNLVISTLLIILIISFLGYKYYTTGDFVKRGIDFKGGFQYVVKYPSNANFNKIFKNLEKNFPGANIRNIASQHIAYIEYSGEINRTTFKNMNLQLLSTRKVKSSIGTEFWKTAIELIIFSYAIVTIIVFLIFRSFVPSIAVILAGMSDIMFAVVMMNILNIPLTMGTLSSLLILIGYSIDTDILLTTRTLKDNPENLLEAIVSSSKTGLTMTTTSIAAMIALIIFSTSVTLDDIAIVILSGLLADIVFTWFQNASILRIYIEKKKKGKEVKNK